MASMTSSDGIRLEYTEAGTPTGRAVVLIAGFKAPATSWVYQQKALAKAGYRVLSFDRRGHGNSEVTELGPTMQRHGQDLQEFLEHLGLNDAVLVGGSQGGNTIWSTVQQFGTARIGGVVIVDQTPSMLNRADWPYGFFGYTEDVTDSYFAKGIPDTGQHSVGSKGIVRIARIARAMVAAKRGPAGFSPTELALLGDHARADWRPAIAQMDKPALLVAGRESEFWPAEHAEASAALSAAVRSVVIEHAGHPTNIEQPAEFNRVLLEFLETL